ncbi:hypothetical protein HY469_03195 [Candidatus Roizmanbacteria bacterium]|nr:hypothetical protein [Candidatus Roizmanbacteria bacterium]
MKLPKLISPLKQHLSLLVLIILMALLPVIISMLTMPEPVIEPNQAAPEVVLKLVPRGTDQLPDGTWQFAQGQQVTVDLVLESHQHEIETVEARLFYDPEILTLTRVPDSVRCSELTKLDNNIFSQIGGVTQNMNGTYAGTETGSVTIFCSAVTPETTQSYDPLPARFSGSVAQVTFQVKKPTEHSSVRIDFSPDSPRNDSNVLVYEGTCCSTSDILGSVENLLFQAEGLSDPTPTPTMPITQPHIHISPATGTFPVHMPLDVGLYIHTAGEQIDSVDTIIIYDPSVFMLSKVEPGTLFDRYSVLPDSALVHTANGRVEISGMIDPDSAPVTGNYLLLATLKFIPKKVSDETAITLSFEGSGIRNDTNMVAYKEGIDILQSVGNASYSISNTLDDRIESILLKIALQGRTELGTPKSRDINVRILNTPFDQQHISERSNSDGEANLSAAHLQNQLPFGTYELLVKPQGYLQQRITVPLLNKESVIDMTDRPFLGGDLNDSGKINGLDWGIYLSHFNSDNELSDLDGSGKVTGLDNSFLILNWNKFDEN